MKERENVFCKVMDAAERLYVLNLGVCCALGVGVHTEMSSIVDELISSILEPIEQDKYGPIHTIVNKYVFTYDFGKRYNGDWLTIFNGVKYSPTTSKELYNILDKVFLSNKREESRFPRKYTKKKPLFENKTQKGKLK